MKQARWKSPGKNGPGILGPAAQGRKPLLWLDSPGGQAILVGLLLCLSGNPVICSLPTLTLAVVAVCLAAALDRRGTLVTMDLVLAVWLFSFVLLVQCLDFHLLPTAAMGGFLVRLYIGYAVVRLIPDFPRVYVHVMSCLALLSLCFYVPSVLLASVGVNLEPFWAALAERLGTATPCGLPLLVHTFCREDLWRNAGMFWEPGAFQGYLTLALICLWVIRERLPARDYGRYFAILSVVLFTTLSTTGYLVYPLVLILHYDWRAKERRRRLRRVLVGGYVLLPLLVAICTYAYIRLEFLQAKMESQFDTALDQQEEGWHTTRLGSLLFDWEYIKRRPLTGWGLNDETRFALDPQYIGTPLGHGNGMSDFTARFGVTGMLIWLLAVSLAVLRLAAADVGRTLLILVVLLLVLQGEAYLGYPLFLGLMFLRGRSGPNPRALPGHLGGLPLQIGSLWRGRIAPQRASCAVR